MRAPGDGLRPVECWERKVRRGLADARGRASHQVLNLLPILRAFLDRSAVHAGDELRRGINGSATGCDQEESRYDDRLADSEPGG